MHLDKLLGAIGNNVGRVDDYVQGGVRDHILRLPNDGSRLPEDARFGALREAMGVAVNQSRNPDADTWYKRGAGRGEMGQLLGARAAQVGIPVGITAAGAALLNTGEGLKEASKSQKGPLYDFTETDYQVMEDVRKALTDGSLSEIELHEAAKNGAFTKPQLLLISDIHDWSRLGQEHYPFGNQTIMEAVSP